MAKLLTRRSTRKTTRISPEELLAMGPEEFAKYQQRLAKDTKTSSRGSVGEADITIDKRTFTISGEFPKVKDMPRTEKGKLVAYRAPYGNTGERVKIGGKVYEVHNVTAVYLSEVK